MPITELQRELESSLGKPSLDGKDYMFILIFKYCNKASALHIELSLELWAVMDGPAAPANPWSKYSGKCRGTPYISFSEVLDEELSKKLQLEDLISSEFMDPAEAFFGNPVNLSAVTSVSITKDSTEASDMKLATLLQKKYDREYNQYVELREKREQGESGSSLDVFEVNSHLTEEDSEVYDREDEEDFKQASYLTKAKKYGFCHDGEQGFISKHDFRISAAKHGNYMRNFRAVETGLLPTDYFFPIGNKAFNSLKKSDFELSSRRIRLKEKNSQATYNSVMDHKTEMIIFKLINKEVISGLTCQISTGKEAHIFFAAPGRAVKLYKTTLSEFKRREEYIQGDYRFKNYLKKSNNRKLIQLWSEKECANLKRMKLCGVPCPTPIFVKDNVLVMSYIGQDSVLPAPKLKDLYYKQVSKGSKIFLECIFNMRKLFHYGNLVHADLSEYNILYFQKTVYFIDVGQAVDIGHPNALTFLYRDCRNLYTHFCTRNIVLKISALDIFTLVIDPSLDSMDALQSRFLEKEELLQSVSGERPHTRPSPSVYSTLAGVEPSLRELKDIVAGFEK
ncbi:hypothetical protein Zmor_016314 [Zophobas morio]|uniref:non-specific serine/threonine protein kinase n=1 Tax=Zophobas morio TaxID=2755281 RepID=A0AA38LZI0_9CUCU|nr:hypothetical protein Zmor_016314 [Zophobas morio]